MTRARKYPVIFQQEGSTLYMLGPARSWVDPDHITHIEDTNQLVLTGTDDNGETVVNNINLGTYQPEANVDIKRIVPFEYGDVVETSHDEDVLSSDKPLQELLEGQAYLVASRLEENHEVLGDQTGREHRQMTFEAPTPDRRAPSSNGTDDQPSRPDGPAPSVPNGSSGESADGADGDALRKQLAASAAGVVAAGVGWVVAEFDPAMFQSLADYGGVSSLSIVSMNIAYWAKHLGLDPELADLGVTKKVKELATEKLKDSETIVSLSSAIRNLAGDAISWTSRQLTGNDQPDKALGEAIQKGRTVNGLINSLKALSNKTLGQMGWVDEFDLMTDTGEAYREKLKENFNVGPLNEYQMGDKIDMEALFKEQEFFHPEMVMAEYSHVLEDETLQLTDIDEFARQFADGDPIKADDYRIAIYKLVRDTVDDKTPEDVDLHKDDHRMRDTYDDITYSHFHRDATTHGPTIREQQTKNAIDLSPHVVEHASEEEIQAKIYESLDNNFMQDVDTVPAGTQRSGTDYEYTAPDSESPAADDMIDVDGEVASRSNPPDM